MSARTRHQHLPTSGLEHIVFEYGEQIKTGKFKFMMESMAKYMAGLLKKGGSEAAKAIKKQKYQPTRSPRRTPFQDG